MALKTSLVLQVFITTSCVGVDGKFLAAQKETVKSLNDTITRLVGHRTPQDDRRMAIIEQSLVKTFQALPKIDGGRLAPRAVRYIAHNYFAKEHGWLLEGLPPMSMQTHTSEMHNATIFGEKAPALVEALLEDRQGGRGLSLSDVVLMISSIEWLIFAESLDLLKAAYRLSDLTETESLDAEELLNVISTYLMLLRSPELADYFEDHQDFQDQKERSGFLREFADFGRDAMLNFEYANRGSTNPFIGVVRYSFATVTEIIRGVMHDFGKWQNSECRAMKEHLVSLAPEHSGRVPMNLFYAQGKSDQYHFTESEMYLQSIGALDEGHQNQKQVRIANYVAGPSNCIAHSEYYSICCLNECEDLMNELEGEVRAPVASVEHLVRLVTSLSSTTVDAPRQLSTDMVQKLQQIADRHGGTVPLHGRLFAQWMHFSFPNECPYPERLSAGVLSPKNWDSDGEDSYTLSDEEMAQYTMFANESTSVAQLSNSYWSDEEDLLFFEQDHFAKRTFASYMWGVIAKLVPLCILFHVLFQQLAAGAGVQTYQGGVKKDFAHYV